MISPIGSIFPNKPDIRDCALLYSKSIWHIVTVQWIFVKCNSVQTNKKIDLTTYTRDDHNEFTKKWLPYTRQNRIVGVWAIGSDCLGSTYSVACCMTLVSYFTSVRLNWLNCMSEVIIAFIFTWLLRELNGILYVKELAWHLEYHIQ